MTRFVVTIDTEADNQWARPSPWTFENTDALPRLQELCDRYGIVPTYLVTWGVASDAESREILQSLLDQGHCEIGCHLHAWSTPPYEPAAEDSDLHHRYLYEYPAAVQEAKLANITSLLTSTFGLAPRSYRAGRWGADAATVRLLEQMGYLVDTSVSPLWSWAGCPGDPSGSGGPSFAWAPTDVYQPSRQDIAKPGDSQLVEVPATVGFARPIGSRLQNVYRILTHRRTLPRRAARRALRMLGIVRVVWLHPAIDSSTDSIELCRRRIAEGAQSLNMVFHSSELVAGQSQLVQDEAGVQRVWATMERVFEFVTAEPSVEPVALSAFADAASDSRAPRRQSIECPRRQRLK